MRAHIRLYLITDLGDIRLLVYMTERVRIGGRSSARSVRQLAAPLPTRERERPADGGGAHGHLD